MSLSGNDLTLTTNKVGNLDIYSDKVSYPHSITMTNAGEPNTYYYMETKNYVAYHAGRYYPGNHLYRTQLINKGLGTLPSTTFDYNDDNDIYFNMTEFGDSLVFLGLSIKDGISGSLMLYNGSTPSYSSSYMSYDQYLAAINPDLSIIGGGSMFHIDNTLYMGNSSTVYSTDPQLRVFHSYSDKIIGVPQEEDIFGSKVDYTIDLYSIGSPTGSTITLSDNIRLLTISSTDSFKWLPLIALPESDKSIYVVLRFDLETIDEGYLTKVRIYNSMTAGLLHEIELPEEISGRKVDMYSHQMYYYYDNLSNILYLSLYVKDPDSTSDQFIQIKISNAISGN